MYPSLLQLLHRAVEHDDEFGAGYEFERVESVFCVAGDDAEIGCFHDEWEVPLTYCDVAIMFGCGICVFCGGGFCCAQEERDGFGTVHHAARSKSGFS